MVSAVITPRVWVRRVTRVLAAAFGRYASSRMASSTRSRVSGRTFGCSFSTRETVWCDTPASRATSAITGGLDRSPGSLTPSPGFPPSHPVTTSAAPPVPPAPRSPSVSRCRRERSQSALTEGAALSLRCPRQRHAPLPPPPGFPVPQSSRHPATTVPRGTAEQARPARSGPRVKAERAGGGGGGAQRSQALLRRGGGCRRRRPVGHGWPPWPCARPRPPAGPSTRPWSRRGPCRRPRCLAGPGSPGLGPCAPASPSRRSRSADSARRPASLARTSFSVSPPCAPRRRPARRAASRAAGPTSPRACRSISLIAGSLPILSPSKHDITQEKPPSAPFAPGGRETIPGRAASAH